MNKTQTMLVSLSMGVKFILAVLMIHGMASLMAPMIPYYIGICICAGIMLPFLVKIFNVTILKIASIPQKR